MKLYVGNLAYYMIESDLDKLFSCYGPVEHVRIITDHYTRQSKNFGYVVMKTREGGFRAMANLDSMRINDRDLVVKEARPRGERMGLGW
jgi:RNA recognition motif-containing protein